MWSNAIRNNNTCMDVCVCVWVFLCVVWTSGCVKASIHRMRWGMHIIEFRDTVVVTPSQPLKVQEFLRHPVLLHTLSHSPSLHISLDILMHIFHWIRVGGFFPHSHYHPKIKESKQVLSALGQHSRLFSCIFILLIVNTCFTCPFFAILLWHQQWPGI